jgi:hypothetical protein
MKILGNNGGGYGSKLYFLSATERELCNLMNYSYSCSGVAEKLNTAGSEIPISAMYDRLYDMANMEKRLMEISVKLKTAADFVDSALPTIKSVNKDNKEEDEKPCA